MDVLVQSHSFRIQKTALKLSYFLLSFYFFPHGRHTDSCNSEISKTDSQGLFRLTAYTHTHTNSAIWPHTCRNLPKCCLSTCLSDGPLVCLSGLSLISPPYGILSLCVCVCVNPCMNVLWGLKQWWSVCQWASASIYSIGCIIHFSKTCSILQYISLQCIYRYHQVQYDSPFSYTVTSSWHFGWGKLWHYVISLLSGKLNFSGDKKDTNMLHVFLCV